MVYILFQNNHKLLVPIINRITDPFVDGSNIKLRMVVSSNNNLLSVPFLIFSLKYQI
jgi:hypothetical protein